jgi:hypothetical protein
MCFPLLVESEMYKQKKEADAVDLAPASVDFGEIDGCFLGYIPT